MPTKNVQLSANASSWAPRMRNWLRLRKAEVPECVTVSNSILRFACGACRIAFFVSVVDSYTFLSPRREFWSRKGWHNRIRHVDPPPKKSNLFQELKLTQQATAHDPDPHRRADTDTYVPAPRGQIRIRNSMCRHRAGKYRYAILCAGWARANTDTKKSLKTFNCL